MNTEESNSIKMFPAGLRVLVVDDDEICLKMVETMLKRCEYEVVAVQNAMDALSILRERRGGFDLVLTDVHMPEMDGFELLEHIGQEFKLPVIMISVDSQETLVTRSLENGASFYLFKPLSMNEIKNLWQYVFLKRGSENNAIPENGNVGETLTQGRASEGDIECASSVNEGNWKQQESKKTSDDDSSSDEEDKEHSNNQKRARVVWHNGLHEKFLKAIDRLGIDKAVPKKILQQMGVPGLTRENVASHLQKYRIFLRRYKDANGSTVNFARSLSDATFRSTFGSPHPSLVYNLPQGLPQFPQQQQQQQQQRGQTPFQPGFRGNIQGFNTPVNMPSIGASHFFNQDASVSNPMPQLRHGQSLSMNNQGNLQHPLFDTGLNVSHRSATNSFGFGNVSNSTRMSTSLHGDSTGFGRNAGSVQMAHQQAHMGFGNSAYSLGYNSNALNLHGQKNISSIENVGSFGNGDQLPNNNNNFAGIQVTSNGNLAGLYQMRPIGNAILNGAYSSFNRKDDIRRGKMPINATENPFPILESNSPNFGNAAQNAASSNGFASAHQFPTMFNNVIQQQPLLAQRPPLLQQQQQQQQQQQTFEDGGSEIDGLLGMLKNNSISQLLDYDADFSDVIFKDAEQSSEQQQDGEEIVDADFNFSAYQMDNNPPSI